MPCSTRWRGSQQARAAEVGERAASALRVVDPREQEVITFVCAGLLNKQVAGELGVTEITVKVHRGNAMRKMGARSLADMVRMALVMGLHRPR